MSADVISCKAQTSFSPVERETSLLISARNHIDKSNLIPELVSSPLTASKLIRSSFLNVKQKDVYNSRFSIKRTEAKKCQ